MSVMQIWVQCWFLNWGMLMKIASWNVNSLNVRLPHVLQWLENHPVDVLALQELKLDQDKFPISAIEEAGYHAVWFGQKTYNGVALLFKGEATDVVTGIPNYADEQRRMIAATINGVRIINLYVVNGQDATLSSATNNLVRVRVTRSVQNVWTLERDLTGGQSFVSEGTGTDATHQRSAFFGGF